MGRRFTGSQRIALYLASDGRCTLCGATLERGWHADHITPYSTGGGTDVANGQALCPECNLKKGARMPFVPRRFQQDVHDVYFEAVRKDFLLMALPGAGKTLASLYIASQLLDRDIIDSVVVVVPRDALKRQWADEARKVFGLELNHNAESDCAICPPGFDGLCCTYQQVNSCPPVFRRECGRKRAMVILDEIHHVGVNCAWGASIQQAFEPASRRFALTGTPFRKKDSPIPFITYERGADGVVACKPDYTYDYDKAIRDSVIRITDFRFYDGDFTWMDKNGEVQESRFDEEVDEADQSPRLISALTKGKWLDKLIKDAEEQRLQYEQQGDENAAAIAIAMKDTHATDIAKRIKAVTHIDPVVVTYKTDNAAELISKFRKSRDPWIVAINMVSEGVDIKRLRVGVYATNVTAPLYFRQVIGRTARFENEGDHVATWFMPKEERLFENAESIREAQMHAITEEEKESQERQTSTSSEPRAIFSSLPLDAANPELDGVLIEAQSFDGTMFRRIQPHAIKYGINPTAFLRTASECGMLATMPDRQEGTSNEGVSLSDKIEALGVELNAKASKLDYMMGVPQGTTHRRWIDLGGKSQKQRDFQDMQKKLAWICREIQSRIGGPRRG